jgi:hypothetical protein
MWCTLHSLVQLPTLDKKAAFAFRSKEYATGLLDCVHTPQLTTVLYPQLWEPQIPHFSIILDEITISQRVSFYSNSLPTHAHNLKTFTVHILKNYTLKCLWYILKLRLKKGFLILILICITDILTCSFLKCELWMFFNYVHELVMNLNITTCTEKE